MTFTYDPTTDIGKVRLIVPDKVEDDSFFTDEEIEALLTVETGWRRAAALALETIASDSAMVLQVIKIQNITTDGSKVAQSLLTRAKNLREQADSSEAEDDPAFDIAEVIRDNFGYRQKIYNDVLIRG